MAILPIFKFAGLQLTDNELASIPDGSCVRAENVVSTGHGVIEPRAGQSIFTGGSAFNGMPLEIFYPTNLTPDPGPQTFTRILSSTGDRLIRILDNGTPDVYQDPDGLDDVFAAPSEVTHRMKGAEAGRNFYITTEEGVRRVETADTATPVRKAGVPRNAGIIFGTFKPDANGAFPALPKVSYRIVLGYRDDNDVLYLGPPSPAFSIYSNDVGSSGPLFRSEFTVKLPPGVDESYFVQVYRTDTVHTATILEDPFLLTTGDEMRLVMERYVTLAESVAGTMAFVDNTPDGFLQVPLYTNQNSGEGIVTANTPPPHCQDITQWEDRLWYANTNQLQKTTVSLLGVMDEDHTVTGTNNTSLRRGDVLYIGGVGFVAAASVAGASIDSATYTGLTEYNAEMEDAYPASRQVEVTARNLVAAINTEGTFQAAYTADSDLNPGQITITGQFLNDSPFELRVDTFKYTPTNVARSGGTTVTVTIPGSLSPVRVGDSVTLSYPGASDANFPAGTFVVTACTGLTFSYTQAGVDVATGGPANFRYQRTIPDGTQAWSPSPPLLGAPADKNRVLSTSDDFSNRLYYSKAQLPEAVPELNYLDVGQPGKPILRILPLRNRLVVFKADGIFLVYGVEPFSVESLDSTVVLTAPDSAVAVSNQVIALTNQGVVTVTEGGVTIISRPIESELNAYQKETFYSKTGTFATAHDVAHLYVLWMGRTSTGVSSETKYSDFAYVLNTLTGAWTKWKMHQRTCGRVNTFNTKLGTGSLGSALDEDLDAYWEDNTKSWDETASIDEVFTWDADTLTLVLTSAAGGDMNDVSPGDRMSQANGDPEGFEGIVSSVDVDTRTVTFASTNGVPPVVGDLVDVHKAFECVVEYAAITCGDPTSLKQFRDIDTHFRSQVELLNYSFQFATDLATQESSFTHENVAFTIPPDPVSLSNRRPTLNRAQLPQNVQRGAYLHLAFRVLEAGAKWALNGISLVFELGSERNKVR